MGLKIAVESIEFFTTGTGRPGARIHQQPFRWVPNDARRLADGDKITYMFDESHGATASGLSSAQTEAAIEQALSTWAGDPAVTQVSLTGYTVLRRSGRLSMGNQCRVAGDYHVGTLGLSQKSLELIARGGARKRSHKKGCK